MAQSTIRAFRNILSTHCFKEAQSRPEEFAIKRFLKKMEVPNDQLADSRKHSCFAEFIEFDRNLPRLHTLPGEWYLARLMIHKIWGKFKLADAVLTNGSEVSPTFGRNSIESKLMRSRWDCTPECFDLWAETAYSTRAIRVAAKFRFRSFCHKMGWDRHHLCKEWWRDSFVRYPNDSQKDLRVFEVFKRILSHVTLKIDHSRFATVRKNNVKDRPIDLQPICNMVVQRRIGNGIRSLLKNQFGVDLNSLADKHRLLIKNDRKATIDLQNASDSISLELIRFLFPSSALKLIENSRTFMTFGLDDMMYPLNKVSSMGNGFTFELMSFLLYCVGQQLDSEFSVFGDDIIIDNQFAPRLIEVLETVGFVINKDKSFINSDFRESCGANWLDGYGYIESYDFEYPNSITDCIVLYNKTVRLMHYPSFKHLNELLTRAIPMSLRGTRPSNKAQLGGPQDPLNDLFYFWTPKKGTIVVKSSVRKDISSWLSRMQLSDDFYVTNGFVQKMKDFSVLRDIIRPSVHIGKYFMYLHGGRRTRDILTGSGVDVQVTIVVVDQRAFRLKDILQDLKGSDG